MKNPEVVTRIFIDHTLKTLSGGGTDIGQSVRKEKRGAVQGERTERAGPVDGLEVVPEVGMIGSYLLLYVILRLLKVPYYCNGISLALIYFSHKESKQAPTHEKVVSKDSQEADMYVTYFVCETFADISLFIFYVFNPPFLII